MAELSNPMLISKKSHTGISNAENFSKIIRRKNALTHEQEQVEQALDREFFNQLIALMNEGEINRDEFTAIAALHFSQTVTKEITAQVDDLLEHALFTK